eukprot:901288-Pyramimonas_sp.AAC.1
MGRWPGGAASSVGRAPASSARAVGGLADSGSASGEWRSTLAGTTSWTGKVRTWVCGSSAGEATWTTARLLLPAG